MKLGVLNIDVTLANFFPKEIEITHLDTEENLPQVDALFIDWIPRSKRKTYAIVQQAKIIKHYTRKKQKILIFDRYLGLTQKEFNWLKNFDVTFLEPAIKYRENFDYLPIWTELYDLKSYPDIEIKEKIFDLGTKDLLKNKIASFEDYYVKFSLNYPKKSVVYWSNLLKEKEEEYKEVGIRKTNFDFEKLKATVLIGTPLHYNIGYLYPEVFNLMRVGCLPLLPKEHKYFWSLFDELVIDKIGYINYNLGIYETVAIPMIVDVYEKIREMFPEMNVEYTINFLMEKLK